MPRRNGPNLIERHGLISLRNGVALRGLMSPPGTVAYEMPPQLASLFDAAEIEVAAMDLGDQAVRRLADHLPEVDWPRIPPVAGPLYAAVGHLRTPHDVLHVWGLRDLESFAVRQFNEALDRGALDRLQRAASAACAAVQLRQLLGMAIGGQYRPRQIDRVTTAKIERAWLLFERAWCRFAPIFVIGIVHGPLPSAPAAPGPGGPNLRLVSTPGPL